MTERSALSAGNGGDYINELLAYLGDRDPMECLGETANTLSIAIAELKTAAAAIKPEPDKWSVVEVMQHLADSEWVFGYRLRKVLTEDAPAISSFDQDSWANRLNYEKRHLFDAHFDFSILREANLRLLESVAEDDWERHGVHAERGKETVHDMVRLEAAHDLFHIQQIERIKGSIGKAANGGD